jgi:hypothetical protein
MWGSDGLGVNLAWPLLLVINNDGLGDPVALGSEAAGAGGQSFGSLDPGQCWTVPLQGLRAVFATCETDTTLSCSILLPQLSPAGEP